MVFRRSYFNVALEVTDHIFSEQTVQLLLCFAIFRRNNYYAPVPNGQF